MSRLSKMIMKINFGLHHLFFMLSKFYPAYVSCFIRLQIEQTELSSQQYSWIERICCDHLKCNNTWTTYITLLLWNWAFSILTWILHLSNIVMGGFMFCPTNITMTFIASCILYGDWKKMSPRCGFLNTFKTACQM